MRRPPFNEAKDAPPPTPGSLRVTALRLLGRRDYSAHELHERLLDRGFATADVADMIDALKSDGTVNDARVAEAHVRTASRIKGRGRHRIRRELEARGIPAPVAESALNALPDEDESEAIRRFLDRKIKSSKISADDRRRLFQQLLRRGYPASAITAALRRREHRRDE